MDRKYNHTKFKQNQEKNSISILCDIRSPYFSYTIITVFNNITWLNEIGFLYQNPEYYCGNQRVNANKKLWLVNMEYV